MAGITGICGKFDQAASHHVVRAAQATVYSRKTSRASLFSGPELIAEKTKFDFMESGPMAASNGPVHAWLDGTVFDFPSTDGGSGQRVFAAALIAAYRGGRLPALLSATDGVFVALLYDESKRELHLFTDRYGLKPFYICHRHQSLLFAPEVKCFPLLPGFETRVRKDMVDCFLQLEHFMDDATWLEGVKVAAPSMHYTYYIAENRLSWQRYWSWSRIRRTSLSIDEAAEAMATLLDNANRVRATGDFRVGVALSGGLDSRAILAAVADRKPVTYTFGVEDSPDVVIARRVARQAGVPHVYYDMRIDQWLQRRFSGVWKTDGMLNMYHMHYAHLMEEIPVIMDVNLSGFLGDAVLGGSYLERKGKLFLNQRITDGVAAQYYGKFHTLCDTRDAFFDIDKIDPYLFYNRGRRMIGMGAEEAQKTIPQQLPFMDIRLMDLSYSLPDEYRANSKVYNKALLLKYPAYFKHIPDATTRVPIANRPTPANYVLEKYHRLMSMVKYKLGIPTTYTDVYNWIKQPETAAVLRTLLDRRSALYAAYTDRNFVTEFLEPHLRGTSNKMKQVMGAATLEIWLQQLLLGNHVPAEKSQL